MLISFTDLVSARNLFLLSRELSLAHKDLTICFFLSIFADIRSTIQNMRRCLRRYHVASTSFQTASRRRLDASFVPYCVATLTRESPAKTFCSILGWSRTTSTAKSSTQRVIQRPLMTNAYRNGMPMEMKCQWMAVVSMTFCKPREGRVPQLNHQKLR